MVFLHGAGQQPDNDVLRRVVEGLRGQDIGIDIVSLPHETDPESVDRYIQESDVPVIIAGHSAGGAKALRLAERFPQRIVAGIVVNPATRVADTSVPTLLLRGTNDHGYSRSEGGTNVTVYAVRGGDHSLRHRRHDQTREETEASAETLAMNRRVGSRITRFLRNLEAP